MDDQIELKREAGEAAAQLVQSGMRLGLGTGSTAHFFTSAVGARLQAGELEGIVAVPTSRATAELALDSSIAVVDLDGPLDLAVDGADEVAADLSLIKGGGGALLREKVVAGAAAQFVVVVDESKEVEALGTTFRLPVEVARFGASVTRIRLSEFGPAEVRGGEHPFVTDNGNYIVDVETGPIAAPGQLDQAMSTIPGVLSTGLFVAMVDLVIVGRRGGLAERR